MAFSGRFALRDVRRITLFDRVSGAVVGSTKSPKVANLEQFQDTDYAMGGVGNVKLAAFDSNKAATLGVELALFNGEILAEQMGKSEIGTFETIQREELAVDATNQITLKYTPVTGGVLTVQNAPCENSRQVYTEGNPGTEVDEYSIAGKVITFNTAVTEGTIIEVFYPVLAETNTTKYTSQYTTFTGVYKVVMDVTVADINDEPRFGQIVMERGKLSGAFTIGLQNEGDIAVQNASIEALGDYCSDALWSFLVYDESDLVTA